MSLLKNNAFRFPKKGILPDLNEKFILTPIFYYKPFSSVYAYL